MKRVYKILIITAILLGGAYQLNFFGVFNPQEMGGSIDSTDIEEKTEEAKEEEGWITTNDTIYKWNEIFYDMEVSKGEENQSENIDEFISFIKNATDPIEITWKVLMDIEYKMRYFKELDMEIYAPIFSRAVKALKDKEVIIQGYVIPIDEVDGGVVLSYGPFASCFFCGKASPASIISIYFKDEGNRYKLDDFKRFKGKLQLNYDDPNEFYYILNDAVEVR